MPYCSASCQRRDWVETHKKVCHNLKRQSGGVASRLETEPEPVIPAAGPLRRPRSPETSPRDSGSDRMPPRKFGPPGNATAPTPVAKSYNTRPGGYNRTNQESDRGQSDRGRHSDNRAQSDNRGNSYNKDNSDNRGQSDNRGNSYNKDNSDNRGRFNRSADDDTRPTARPANRDGYRKNEDRPRNQDGGNRRPSGQGKPRDDEDWGPKSEQKAPSKSLPEPAVAGPSRAPPLPVVADVAPVPAPARARPPAAAAAASASPAVAVARPPLVPKNCMIETLQVNDTFMLTVETAEGSGYVCVSLNEDHSDNYERLFEPLSQACEAAAACDPEPGSTFAYLDESEGGWYRARRLSCARAALLDAARAAALAPGARCAALPRDYAAIPEFSCLLEADKLEPKDQLQCTILSKTGGELSVSLINLETGASSGCGTVRRWLPAVERPPQPAAAAGAPSEHGSTGGGPGAAAPAEVPRPPVTAGSRVVLVDGSEPGRVFVRPAGRARQAEFDDLVCEIALYGANEATPKLKELPAKGQIVLALFTDGYYRALVQRVSSKHKRCLLEYIEYGNVDIVEDLATLCPCPPQFELSARPTLTSAVTLVMKQKTFSEAATAYLNRLKEDFTELILTIPSGEKSGPSKTGVRLVVAESGEDVCRAVDALSTPEWQQLMERGGDVLETETFNFNSIEYVDPPFTAGEFEILDCSLLEHGQLSGHARGAPHAARALALTPRLAEYCNSELAKDPYLPKLEELCIAMCPIKNQWLRAVVLQQEGGPGGPEVQLLFYDYGHLALVPVSSLRKMMPEFARGIPAAVYSLVIKGFPSSPTPVQLEAARRHLRVTDAGAGVGALAVTAVARTDVGEYTVHAPQLLHAMGL